MSFEQTLLYAVIINPFVNFIISCFTFIKELCVVSLSIHRGSRYFACMDLFLEQQTQINATNIKMDTVKENIINRSVGLYSKVKGKYLNEGKHIYWYKNRLIFVNKALKETNHTLSSSVEITIPFGTKKFIDNMLEDIINFEKRNKNFYKYNYFRKDDNYCVEKKRRKISYNSIILPNKIKENITMIVKKFIEDEEWYIKMSIQYKLGLLLEGIPGSGKSSLAFLLASQFDLPIIYLPIEKIESRSIDFEYDRYICLIEDIDRSPKIANNNNEKDKETLIKEKEDNKFNNLLQLLDGINTPNGCIFILTSNKTTKLDPALIRPGRIDHIIQFEAVRPEEARKLFMIFFPDEEDACEDFIQSIEFTDTLSMAALKGHLTEHRDDLVKAKKFVN